MFDPEILQTEMARAARHAVREELSEAQAGIELAQLVVALLKKPLLLWPQDCQTILSCGRSTAFTLANSPDFPPRIQIGRRRWCETSDFLAWMRSQKAPPISEAEMSSLADEVAQ